MNFPTPSSNWRHDCLQVAAVLFFIYFSVGTEVADGNSPTLLHPTAQKQKLLTLTLSSDAISGMSPPNTPIKFTAKIGNTANHVATGVLNWSTKSTTTSLPLIPEMPTRIDAGKSVSFSHTITVPKAGFVEMVCEFTQSGAEKPIRQTLRIGCNPDKVIAPLTRQPDFEEFWEQAIKELKDVPPAFESRERLDLSDDRIQVFEVSMRSHNQTRVRGWLEVPRNVTEELPAVIRVPGYGQNMKPIGKCDDMIVFSFNPRGHGNSQQDVPGKPNNFWIRGLDNPQIYYYRGSYLDCIRAVDFIATRKDVNQEKIAVWGGSQGGGFALATAALDPRVDHCIADIPFLCDWIDYFRLTQWPEMDEWIADQPHRNWQSTMQTLSYFDTMNLADRINCPTLMSVGLQDSVCPPTTCFHTFNRIPGAKKFRIYPSKRHGLGKEHYAWVWTHLRKAFAVPE